MPTRYKNNSGLRVISNRFCVHWVSLKLKFIHLSPNYLGAMLGNGEVWINNTPNSTPTNYDFYISAINNRN